MLLCCCFFLDQERRIREMLSIVEGNTDEVRHSEGGEEKATPSVAKARYQKKRYVLINGHETPLKIY